MGKRSLLHDPSEIVTRMCISDNVPVDFPPFRLVRHVREILEWIHRIDENGACVRIDGVSKLLLRRPFLTHVGLEDITYSETL